MGKILYVLENPNNWINYAPALVKLARENHADIVILEDESLYGPFLTGDHFTEMQTYFQTAGIKISTEHQGSMGLEEIEHHAHEIGADIIAHAKATFLERIFGDPTRAVKG